MKTILEMTEEFLNLNLNVNTNSDSFSNNLDYIFTRSKIYRKCIKILDRETNINFSVLFSVYGGIFLTFSLI